MSRISEFKESFLPEREYSYTGHLAETWYAAETQHYQDLVDSGLWVSEMDGYDIRDDLDEIPTTSVGENKYPGHMVEIMDVFGDFNAGPWQAEANLDLEKFRECLDEGYRTLGALLNAEHEYNRKQEIRDKQRETALFFLRRAGEKAISGDSMSREILGRVSRAFARVMQASENPPVSVGFEPVIEDLGYQNDLKFTRCEAEDLDNWAEKQTISAMEKSTGPEGICLDRVRELQTRAIVRRERFFRLFDFVCRGNPSEIAQVFRWSPKGNHGRLWLRIAHEHRNNPEPGLQYLTKSQTVVLSFMARRRLGWKVSAGLVKSVRWACANLLESCTLELGLDDFNICDLEASVNGYSKFLVELTSWVRSGYTGQTPESIGG